MRTSVALSCKKAYRERKTKFKAKWWTARDGPDHSEEIRAFPPPDMTEEAWGRCVDHFTTDEHMQQAERNAINRSKQLFASLHGGKSYAQLRHERGDSSAGRPASLIDEYGRTHRKPNNEYVDEEVARRHAEMLRLRDERRSSSSSVDESRIMEEVLGECSGFNRGVGRKHKVFSQASTSQEPQGRLYTEEHVQRLEERHRQDRQYFHQQIANLVGSLRARNIDVPDIGPLPTFEDYPVDDEDDTEELDDD